jgi:putative membrane protein
MLKYVGRPLLLLALWDVLVVVGCKALHWDFLALKELPLALYGSVIGIVVGFRNNSAYGRWWEARKLWGRIVNNSRSLARQACSSIRAQNGTDHACAEKLVRKLVMCQIAFAHALRQHLRGLNASEELARLLPAPDAERLGREHNVPLAIQQEMARMLLAAKESGWIDALQWQSLDRNLDELADAQGGVERIKNTPMPHQYDYFPGLFVHVYCTLLPLGMVAQLGWLTPLGSTLVGFMLLALNRIGNDLEDPFDNTVHDIPMTSITTTIERNLLCMLGHEKLPEPVQAEAGVLW